MDGRTVFLTVKRDVDLLVETDLDTGDLRTIHCKAHIIIRS